MSLVSAFVKSTGGLVLKSDSSNKGIGTEQTGYAPPAAGPFSCSNCIHFDKPNKCDNPKVVSDPKVKGLVDAAGCCNYFRNEE